MKIGRVQYDPIILELLNVFRLTVMKHFINIKQNQIAVCHSTEMEALLLC